MCCCCGCCSNGLFYSILLFHHSKTLLVRDDIDCEDLTEDSDDCELERILRAIINGQNEQIQAST